MERVMFGPLTYGNKDYQNRKRKILHAKLSFDEWWHNRGWDPRLVWLVLHGGNHKRRGLFSRCGYRLIRVDESEIQRVQ